MKELAFIIAVVWWLVPASAQDTLKEMTLPDVHITAFHQGFVGESVDSLFWSQRITTDLGRVLEASGLANSMLYGAPGSAALLRINGTAPDHAQVLWNGIPVASSSLGMADLSLVPVFFLDGIQLGGSGMPRIGRSGIGGDVHLMGPSAQSSGRMVQLTTGYSSLLNQFHGIRAAHHNGSWSWDFRSMVQSNRNRFSYPDPYRPDAPVISQQRNDAMLAGSALHSAYTKGHHRLGFALWWVGRTMRIPPMMGMIFPPPAVQRDNQMRGMFSHLWSSASGRWTAESALAVVADHQFYGQTDHSEEGLESRIRNRTVTGYSRVVRHGRSGNSITATASVQRPAVWYNQTSRHAALVPGAQLCGTWFVRRFSFTGEAQTEWWSHRGPAGMGMAGAYYHATGKHQIVTGLEVSRRLRQPDFNELFWSPGGNLLLKDESSHAARAVLRLEMLPGVLAFRTSAYFMKVNNWIQWMPSSAGYWSPVNVKQVWSRGLDACAQLFPQSSKGFRADISYHLNLASGNNAGSDDHFVMVYSPAHRMHVNAEYRFARWMASVQARGQSRRFTDEDNNARTALDAFGVVDCALFTRFTRGGWNVDAGVRIENVLNHRYELVRMYALPGRLIQLQCTITRKTNK